MKTNNNYLLQNVIARHEDKAPIKRKQNQACLSYAEHEVLRQSQSRTLCVK